ncbi:DUF938 domain-containing protein [Novosphingobium resinovorum]|uniref:DUF938 domain-containing protein n=1 Tax=Sphingomonadaceae TaxID=41297 RepID=UPI00027C98FE|nr:MULTISPECIES: DUF938 domain-containing protein [Sphingomonadaceae]EJU09489.1 hypothetical protein LH128_28680 [Sphingomonas sp. LH128]MBF7012216.1 DUF938 domain-containing protein [Novosphingobium sp. HR1a]WJM26962.1 DUF938 domain-containing protein [Novosphingobium resinovorum]
MENDARREAPATARNRDPILSVLRDVLPVSGHVLEIASGTGEHAIHFAAALPDLVWQPTDPDANARASIAAWGEQAELANLRAPLELDAASHEWPITEAQAVVCINMIHISPWTATEGLMAGAARVLESGYPLVLYGPYRREGLTLEPSNAAFDEDLKRRNPEWGLRSVETVRACALDNGLAFDSLVEMPANNLMLVFRKR